MKDLYFDNIFFIENNVKGIWIIENTNFQRETRSSVIHIGIDESLIKPYFAVEKKYYRIIITTKKDDITYFECISQRNKHVRTCKYKGIFCLIVNNVIISFQIS